MSEKKGETKARTVLPRAVALSHQWLRECLRPGDSALDGTVGNGHDTVFLAEEVGPSGRVYGFDIQPVAIDTARRRLMEQDLLERATLFPACHSTLGECVEGPLRGGLFNLGYLPGGGDKQIITRPSTTLAALEGATDRLSAGGRVVVVIYPGHPGGKEEAEAVESWASALSQETFTVVSYRFLNQANRPPYLVAIERRGEGDEGLPNSRRGS